jgi:hypothetical protein
MWIRSGSRNMKIPHKKKVRVRSEVDIFPNSCRLLITRPFPTIKYLQFLDIKNLVLESGFFQ